MTLANAVGLLLAVVGLASLSREVGYSTGVSLLKFRMKVTAAVLLLVIGIILLLRHPVLG
jgi:hypothetical protein